MLYKKDNAGYSFVRSLFYLTKAQRKQECNITVYYKTICYMKVLYIIFYFGPQVLYSTLQN